MKNKKIIIVLFVIFSNLVVFGFSQNVNKLKIVPNLYTGRYYCPVAIQVGTENNGVGHTNCQYLIKFDSNNFDLYYSSRGSAFDQTDYIGVDDDIIRVAEKNGEFVTQNAICSNLFLNTKTSNLGSALLKFVDFSGNDPTPNTFIYTDDLLNLSNNGADTLTGVENAVVNFEMCPCTLDSKAPFSYLSYLDPIGINGGRVLGKTNISMLFLDKGGTLRNYWYDGNPINTGNYVLAPIGMDNQEGVDSGTISVLINYSDKYGVVDQYLTSSNLSVSRYTGNIQNIPELTWDNNDRGYWVEFSNATDFAVEWPVTITISGYDNALQGNQPCIRDAALGTETYIFNNYQLPYFSNFSPYNGEEYVDYGLNIISFYVNDNWAGVDTGSMYINIPEILSGAEVLMTGYIYSGYDLNFSGISGTPGLGNAGSYLVSFIPKWEFPANTTILLSGVVVDLAGYTGNSAWTFNTRPDCSFYGCLDIVDIFTMTGLYFNGGLPFSFTGSLIVVTGTNTDSIYPYLTGLNDEILMCGLPYNGTILDGNVDIYADDGISVINGHIYTGKQIYVTGLDFIYSGGTIYVN